MIAEPNVIDIESVKPMFNKKRLAIYLGLQTHDGKPCTKTVSLWINEGKVPPPDLILSSRASFWKHETIMTWIETGGYNL